MALSSNEKLENMRNNNNRLSWPNSSLIKSQLLVVTLTSLA